MKRVILILACVLAASVQVHAQTKLRPRLGSREAPALPVTPLTQITSPTSSPTYETSVAAMSVEVLCSDDAGDCTTVTWTCSTCTPTSGTATQGGNGLTWSFSLTQTCSAGAGTAHTITATGSDGTLTSQDVLVSTCTIPDAGPPTVTITSPAGATDGTDAVTVGTYVLGGTCTDDVACVSVTITCATCVPTSLAATFAGGAGDWTGSIGLTSGANAITVTALDQAGNNHTDTVTTTLTAPLTIATGANLGTCTEDVAGCSKTVTSSGGTGSKTWTESGSALNAGNCTGLTVADVGDTAVVSGTPNPASVPVACEFSLQVQDGAAATATQAFTITIVQAGSESSHTYFLYQTSNRSACTSTATGTNCIVQTLGTTGNTACPNSTYGHNGACSLRNQAQLNAIGSLGNGTLTDKQRFNYVYATDPLTDKQDAARMWLPGGAGAPSGSGCTASGDPSGPAIYPCLSQHNQDEFDLGWGQNVTTGSITVIVDEYWPAEWRQNSCGGGVGGRNGLKKFNIMADGIYFGIGTYWQKAAHFTCADNVIGTTDLRAQSASAGGINTTTITSKVTPKSLGVTFMDHPYVPPGKGAYFDSTLFTGDEVYQSYPIKSATWTRIIMHVDFNVDADSALFDAWRSDCDAKAVGTASDTACATLGVGAPQDGATWHRLSYWMCDETRGCQRIAHGIIDHNTERDNVTQLIHTKWRLQFDSSGQPQLVPDVTADLSYYIRNAIIIRNIASSDLDDTGCPSACTGDSALGLNIFRKPVR